jgi:serine/threonine kinase 32
VDLSHFALLRSVGKGAFGKVRVVQHKGSKQLFALKYINKTRCIQMRAVENIISERRLLERIDCGLIVNLRYAFQDDDYLFLALDLMTGGDIRFHLDRLGVMPEAYVQFYAAEVSWALRYLHKKNIVHRYVCFTSLLRAVTNPFDHSCRDLKPDNILLSDQGHAHLTDFNIAVQFSESKPLTSVAGSLAYMGPEILLKRGYFASVDWWSLGVVCYELLVGKVGTGTYVVNQMPNRASSISDRLEGRRMKHYNRPYCMIPLHSQNQAMFPKKLVILSADC